MNFYVENSDLNQANEKKDRQVSELKEEDLLSIVGGQSFHNEKEKLMNRQNVTNIVKGII